MEQHVSWVVFLIPIAGIIGGFVMAGLGIYANIRRREFEHRERLAMIEKGITPPGSAADRIVADALDEESHLGYEEKAARTRRGGFVVMAIGLGIAFMLWMLSHEVDAAIGIGGFLVILGAAIFISSFVGGRRARPPESRKT